MTPAITSATPNDEPVGRDEVVFVETPHPVDHVLDVAWRLDGQAVPNPYDSRNFRLSALSAGTHTVSATVTDPAAPDVASATRTWTVDNTDPTTTAQLSQPLTTVPDSETHNVYFEQFTMGLTSHDDMPGYVVSEFRLDHDGWFNYFGWPDTPDGRPFLFTPRGTDIKNLTYGSLVVDGGVTCLTGATVGGDVVVRSGGSFVADHGTINGSVTGDHAASVQRRTSASTITSAAPRTASARG